MISVRQTDQYRNGFYIVVMIEGDGQKCGIENHQEIGSDSADNSTLIETVQGPVKKSVRIMIAPTNVDVTTGVVSVLLFYALTCLLAYALVSFQMPVEGKVVKMIKKSDIPRQTRKHWDTALARMSKKKGAEEHSDYKSKLSKLLFINHQNPL